MRLFYVCMLALVLYGRRWRGGFGLLVFFFAPVD